MSELKNLIMKVENGSDRVKELSIVAGFDAFLDQIIKVVEERKSPSDYTPLTSMKEFGKHIQAASNRSAVREIVVESVEIGGCALNLGDGIASLGVPLDYFGTIGKPQKIEFKDFALKCRTCVPLPCDPGQTLAYEFNDGKYMMSSVSHLAKLNSDVLRKEFENGQFFKACQNSELIAMTDWTLYPHMTDCWSFVQEEIFSALDHRPYIYIDLIDPRSRSEKDIREMLAVLVQFEKYGNTIFGGNLTEGNVLAKLYDIETVEDEGEDVAVLASKLREIMGISQVALHSISGAAYADKKGYYWADGPHCTNPKKSTGAGDRYNAGFCFATMMDFEPKERLLFANATSGFFVRNGYSGSLKEVTELIKAWDNKTLDC